MSDNAAEEDERERGETEKVLQRQMKEGLAGLGESLLARLVVAYEPVWAIGTGKTATPEIAQQAHRYTRNLLGSMYNTRLAEATAILYGGSVKADNLAALLSQPDVDGGLVGGASVKIDSWKALIETASAALSAV